MGLLWFSIRLHLSWGVLMYCPTTVKLPEASVVELAGGLSTPSPKQTVLNSTCPERECEEFCPGSITADPTGRGKVTGRDVHSSLRWGQERATANALWPLTRPHTKSPVTEKKTRTRHDACVCCTTAQHHDTREFTHSHRALCTV